MKYDFKSFLDVKRQIDGQITAKCPFHKDRSPSFSANSKTGLWKCFAGCGEGNFSHFLERIKPQSASKNGIGGNPRSKGYIHDSNFQTVATYEYMSTDGEYHLRVIRQENGSSEKRFFQEHKDENGRWVKGGATKLLFPYLFHEWNGPGQKLLFLVEGEKCVEFLKAKGLCATTVAGGSSKWLSYYGLFFKNKQVIILPDNDDIGKKFALSALSTLTRSEVETCILELPGLNPGEDVVEWLSQHGTVEDLFNLIELSCCFSVR